jgi:SAM-dependent methyltransferase
VRGMPRELSSWMPVGLDLERPNAARVYDYLLGGGCNFEVDRKFAEKVLETDPGVEVAVRQNRAFLGRAVRFCVGQGVRQFLDLGSGIPTVGNVHEIAQGMAPECLVVYVDNEPIAVAHSQLVLQQSQNVDVVLADLLHVTAVLSAEPVHRLLDLTRPMAVILAAVLHFVPDDAHPHAAVAQYVQAMAPGSFLVLSHGARAKQHREEETYRLYGQSSTPAVGRTREEVHALMAGTEIIEPGLVWTSQWRPEFDPGEHSEHRVYAAVGRKP